MAHHYNPGDEIICTASGTIRWVNVLDFKARTIHVIIYSDRLLCITGCSKEFYRYCELDLAHGLEQQPRCARCQKLYNNTHRLNVKIAWIAQRRKCYI